MRVGDEVLVIMETMVEVGTQYNRRHRAVLEQECGVERSERHVAGMPTGCSLLVSDMVMATANMRKRFVAAAAAYAVTFVRTICRRRRCMNVYARQRHGINGIHEVMARVVIVGNLTHEQRCCCLPARRVCRHLHDRYGSSRRSAFPRCAQQACGKRQRCADGGEACGRGRCRAGAPASSRQPHARLLFLLHAFFARRAAHALPSPPW